MPKAGSIEVIWFEFNVKFFKGIPFSGVKSATFELQIVSISMGLPFNGDKSVLDSLPYDETVTEETASRFAAAMFEKIWAQTSADAAKVALGA
jgi:hypothetical protein